MMRVKKIKMVKIVELLIIHSILHLKNKKTGNKSDTHSDSESGDSSSGHSNEDDEYVPDDYIFPSFIAYVLWGPFAIELDPWPRAFSSNENLKLSPPLCSASKDISKD